MNPGLHKKVRIISLVLIGISLTGSSIFILLDKEVMYSLFSAIFLFSLITLLTKYFLQLQEKLAAKKLNKVFWIVFSILSVISGILIASVIAFNLNFGPFIILPLRVILLLLLLLVVFRSFLFNPGSFTGIIIAMTLMAIAILFKKQHWPGAGALISISASFMACGMYASGLASLFWLPKNHFLKYISFIGGSLFAFGFFALLFKMQHWPGAGIYIQVSQIPIVVMTLVFLLTLPKSGYFDWNKLEKRIFGRILIPWIFFIFLLSLIYIFPRGNSWFFYQDLRPWTFQMKNYLPENKNGLVPK
jgi:hypothetical protein